MTLPTYAASTGIKAS